MSARLGKVSFWRLVLAGILLFGAYGAVVRFGQGLGAATHLSDGFPWGLWIGFDVLVGVGLAAGGFSIAATVHIFQLERYKPIARPAVFTAFVGYLLVIVGLLFDLGQPWDVWHPLVMWNPRSVMFEVAWCVMLYTAVLALEFSPVVLERFNVSAPLRLIRALYVPLVVLGVLLSMLHQSSLGTLFVIVPDKLHALWYTPWLPVFFFITAIAAGLAMTIVESYLSERAFGRQLEHHLLQGLARVIVVLLAVYLGWRLQDLAARGALSLAWQLTRESVMLWGEIGLGVCLPLLLMGSSRWRANPHLLFFAALLTVLGFVAGRLNVAITGMQRASAASYLPSAIELGVTACLVALGFAAFGLAVRHLQLFPDRPQPTDDARSVPPPRPEPSATANGWIVITLWLLLLIGGVLISVADQAEDDRRAKAQATRTPPTATAVQRPTTPSAAQLRLPQPYTFRRSKGSPGAVVFDHQEHIDEQTPACTPCHRDQFSLLAPGKPLRGSLTMQRLKRGELCGSCHNGDDAFAIAPGDCDDCHTE